MYCFSGLYTCKCLKRTITLSFEMENQGKEENVYIKNVKEIFNSENLKIKHGLNLVTYIIYLIKLHRRYYYGCIFKASCRCN